MFTTKAKSFNGEIIEATMELGSENKYQSFEMIEVDPQDDKLEKDKTYKIMMKTVNKHDNSITEYSMSKEEMTGYIEMLKRLQAQL